MNLPNLKDPGVGPPWIARAVNRYLLKPTVIRGASWQSSLAALNKANSLLEATFRSFESNQLLLRVLVPSQRGLEDSSRFWSAAMTARHLTIVGTQIERVIIDLSQLKLPQKKADTALVKPEVERNLPESVDEFVHFSKDLVSRIESQVSDRHSRLKHPHPWFGPMTAKDWFWLLGIHSFIHLKQLKNIQQGLKKND